MEDSDDVRCRLSRARITLTLQEIFTLIQPDDVRALREKQPENLATMYRQAVAQLEQMVETPLTKYFSQGITCIRVLSRLTPFLLEDPGSCMQLNWVYSLEDAWVQELFWNSEHELGKKLIDCSMRLLFLPDFTVTEAAYQAYRQQIESSISQQLVTYPSLMWAAGVGYPDAQNISTPSFEKNRREVLRLLLCCFSGTLYHKPGTLLHTPPTEHTQTTMLRPKTDFCSMQRPANVHLAQLCFIRC